MRVPPSKDNQTINKKPEVSPIWCLDYMDNLIVIGCADGKIEFWESTTGTLKCIYEGEGKPNYGITHLHLSGDRLVAARLNGRIDFLRLETYNQGRQIDWGFMSAYRRTHIRTGSTGSLSNSHLPSQGNDINSIASSSQEEMRCYLEQQHQGHQQLITCLDVVGNTVLTGSQDHTLKVFKLDLANLVFTLHGHYGPITSIFIDHYQSCTGGSGSQDGLLCVWDLITGACCYSIQAHDGAIVSLICSSSYVISMGTDERLYIWERFQGNLLNTINVPYVYTSLLMLTPSLLITAKPGALVIWDVRRGELAREIKLDSLNSHLSSKKILFAGGSVVCDYGNEMRIIRFPIVDPIDYYMATVVIIEAFYGGSHKQLLDTVLENVDTAKYDLFTLPAKKWHWRARTSALYFAQNIPIGHQYAVLFASSVLNLAELIGMRPDLARCKKIIYFHENQLIYPVRAIKERDCQYGLNQIMTCLAADHVVFNSGFNQKSFLDNVNSFLNIQSDLKIKGLREQIELKCTVLYFPIKFHQMPNKLTEKDDLKILHLVWPHRWEHDKNPQLLADALIELNSRGILFNVSIVGEQFQTYPSCFDEIKEKLSGKLKHFGYLSREVYLKCLAESDIVISTADHEFYGVSMLEAVHYGCVPIAPNKLVYPEIYPKDFLFNTDKQLIKMLQNFCKNPAIFRKYREKFFASFSLELFSSENLIPKFLELLTL